MAMSEEIKLDFEVNELQKIKENILITSTKKQIADDLEYEIEILFPVEKEDILFKLEIFVTRKKIFLFTKNLKPFNDGRDIIGDVFPEIANNTFKPEIKLTKLFEALKAFYEKYSKAEIKDNFNAIGKYHLGEEYNLNFISSLSGTFVGKVKMIEKINNKKTQSLCLCTIGEEFLCLYEYSKKNKDQIFLTFYASLRSLTSFKKSLVGNVLTLIWQQQCKKPYEMKLTSQEDGIIDSMVETLIAKLRVFGVKMDIKKHREGELPKIDINKVEKGIPQLENQMKFSGNILVFNKLLSDYEKAVEYYSAINDPKYEIYTKKIQELLKEDRFTKFYVK